MDILIVGSGALACLYAARLAAAGAAVTLLAGWPTGRAALEQAGVRLVEPDGSERAYPVRVIGEPSECAGAGLALVLVKSWQTERAAAQLAACLAPDGLAVTLQNGLGNRETLAAALGAARVAQGATTGGATLLGPGWVKAGGEGQTSLEDNPRLAPLVELLAQSGFQVETTGDLQALLWGKLVINTAINPLSAVLQAPNGALLERPSARALMQAIARETAGVAQAVGVRLPFADPAAAVEAVARDTAANRSSMLQDLQRRAPTEIDAICGAVVAAGASAGIETPYNFALWQLVKALAVNGAPAELSPQNLTSLHFQI